MFKYFDVINKHFKMFFVRFGKIIIICPSLTHYFGDISLIVLNNFPVLDA